MQLLYHSETESMLCPHAVRPSTLNCVPLGRDNRTFRLLTYKLRVIQQMRCYCILGFENHRSEVRYCRQSDPQSVRTVRTPRTRSLLDDPRSQKSHINRCRGTVLRHSIKSSRPFFFFLFPVKMGTGPCPHPCRHVRSIGRPIFSN
jgi:hypothetical protein